MLMVKRRLGRGATGLDGRPGDKALGTGWGLAALFCSWDAQEDDTKLFFHFRRLQCR